MTRRGAIGNFLHAKRPWRRADRVQVGALPWRVGENGLEVLLITSRGTGQWIIPKGGLISGLPPHEAAALEAWEEAGVRGRIEAEETGRFTHLKTRLIGRSLNCRIAVYRLSVEKELNRWPERGERRRRWFSVPDAAAAVRSKELRAIIAALEAGKAGEENGQADE